MRLKGTDIAQVEQKQLANPRGADEEPYKPLAPVLQNSIYWGGFMALSTNVRYQMVNGFEDRFLVSSVAWSLNPTGHGRAVSNSLRRP